MKYYTKDGREFIENGRSKLRVLQFDRCTAPLQYPGRTIRMFIIQEVLKQSYTNLILPGNMIALAFPDHKANSKKHEWGRSEEAQVPLKISLK